MRLTWKDGIATILTAAIVALYVAFLAGASLPLVSAPRALAAVALVVGMTACAVGGSGVTADASTPWYMGAALVVGAATLVVGLATLITGSDLLLAVFVGLVVALWIFATARHAFSGADRGRVTDRELHEFVQGHKQAQPRA